MEFWCQRAPGLGRGGLRVDNVCRGRAVLAIRHGELHISSSHDNRPVAGQREPHAVFGTEVFLVCRAAWL